MIIVINEKSVTSFMTLVTIYFVKIIRVKVFYLYLLTCFFWENKPYDYIKPVNGGGFRVHLNIRGRDLHPGPPSTNLLPQSREYGTTTGVQSLKSTLQQ